MLLAALTGSCSARWASGRSLLQTATPATQAAYGNTLMTALNGNATALGEAQVADLQDPPVHVVLSIQTCV